MSRKMEKTPKKAVCPVKSARSKMARTKGHSFEREIAKRLRVVFPEARRHLEYQDQEANGVDLVQTGYYRVQCKRGRKYAALTAIGEVTHDPLLGEVAVLVTKGDFGDILVAFSLDEFVRLLKKARKWDFQSLERQAKSPDNLPSSENVRSKKCRGF